MPLRLDPSPASLERVAFVARFGGIYEHSPWVAEAAFGRGLGPEHDDPARLADLLATIVEAAGGERHLALLRAHPELAGKLALAGRLGTDSTAEQAAARLDQCSPAELARFTELNARYGERFGFPFIIAVRGLTRAEILAAFERRIGNSRETELRTALDQVHRIARLRLEALAE